MKKFIQERWRIRTLFLSLVIGKISVKYDVIFVYIVATNIYRDAHKLAIPSPNTYHATVFTLIAPGFPHNESQEVKHKHAGLGIRREERLIEVLLLEQVLKSEIILISIYSWTSCGNFFRNIFRFLLWLRGTEPSN